MSPSPAPPSAAPALRSRRFAVSDYDLGATLASGQVFRWGLLPGTQTWEGVLRDRWVRLRPVPNGIEATVLGPPADWHWLTDWLNLDADLPAILASFPTDRALQTAGRECHGLRLLRQDPWECLASFILSSTKQIVQIQDVVERLCRLGGNPIAGPSDGLPRYAFPTAEQVASLPESAVRECRAGFRAPYLLETARRVSAGWCDLPGLRHLPLEAARRQLLQLPGVGPKIADCVLLFSTDHAQAFPVDVWVARALQTHYFGGRKVPLRVMREFAAEHFGPYAGYAQQILFHSTRLGGRSSG